MQGHAALIEMRKQGYAPTLVMIETDPALWCASRDWMEHTPNRAALRIEVTDSLQSLDLRCLVGLKVMVNGCDEQRVEQVTAAAVKAKASRVIGFVHASKASGGFEVVRMTDTEGRIVHG